MFSNKKEKQTKVELLSTLTKDSELFNSFVTLQNEINVAHNTKVIAITSVENDRLAAALGKALATTYSLNGSKSLLIDANMYNPCLSYVIGEAKEDSISVFEGANKEVELKHEKTALNEYLDAVCFDKEVYPGNVFKSKVIQDMIKKEANKYEHFIILVPSIRSHKEVELLSDVVESIVLVAQKDFTKKKDIYEAISFFKERQLPLAKTVLVQ